MYSICDVEKELPNGFHDAILVDLYVDYQNKEAILTLKIFMGTPGVEIEDERVLYRKASLKLKGLIYCAIEPPDQNYPFLSNEALVIDIGSMDDLTAPPVISLPQKIPEDAFPFWIYVQCWNSFLSLAARDSELFWIA